MTESDIRHQIYEAFKKLGITYISTSDNRKSRNTKGCPDIFVWVGHWEGLDAKTPGGKLSAEQEEHVREHRMWIVRSVDEAVRVVQKFQDIDRKIKGEFLRPGTRSIPVKGQT